MVSSFLWAVQRSGGVAKWLRTEAGKWTSRSLWTGLVFSRKSPSVSYHVKWFKIWKVLAFQWQYITVTILKKIDFTVWFEWIQLVSCLRVSEVGFFILNDHGIDEVLIDSQVLGTCYWGSPCHHHVELGDESWRLEEKWSLESVVTSPNWYSSSDPMCGYKKTVTGDLVRFCRN